MKTYCTITTDDAGQIREKKQLSVLFKSIAPKGKYRVTIEEFQARSTPLNDYYWNMLEDEVRPALIYNGYSEFKTKEDVHEFLKLQFKVSSTTFLNNKEFMAYLEEIYRWAAEFLSIAIKSPNSTESFV